MPPIAFQFDLNKCTGCQACVLACKIENQTPLTMNWRSVYTFNENRHPQLPLYHLSLACNHCGDPPCQKYCPAMAFAKDSETGAVTIDAEKCIGCKYCSWNCPFDAPKFNSSRGVMEKCTLCAHRLAENKRPACVEWCPTGALSLTPLAEDREMADIAGFTPTPIKPAIELIPLRGLAPCPELTSYLPVEPGLFRTLLPQATPKIRWQAEWTLVVFTLLAAGLVALVLTRLVVPFFPVNPLFFLGLGVLGMGLSSIHLGRKMRAYRAILNLAQSWLSREIVLYSGFVGLATIWLQWGQHTAGLNWLTAFLGLATLYTIDKVYEVAAHRRRLSVHSAGTLLTAGFLFGLMSETGQVVVAFGLLKLVLYALRKWSFHKAGENPRNFVSGLRITIGLVLPAMLWLGGMNQFAVVISGFIGDVIDRCEFYTELDIITPQKQINQDLQAAVSQLVVEDPV